MKETSFAKDLLSYTAVGASVLYAFGWGMRFAAVSAYGVGSVSISKESAIATAVAALATLSLGGFWLYCLLMIWDPERVHSIPKRIAVTCGLFMALAVLYTASLMGFLRIELAAAVLATFLFQVLASLIFLSLRKVWEDEKNRMTMMVTTLIGLVMFGRAVFPVLPEEYGGMGRSQIEVQLKSPRQVVRGTIVSSDDKWLLVAQPVIQAMPGPYSHQRRAAIMLPADRVVEIVPIGAAASH